MTSVLAEAAAPFDFAGAGVAHGGWHALRWKPLSEIIKFIFIAPFLGFALAFGMIVITAASNAIYIVLRTRSERWLK